MRATATRPDAIRRQNLRLVLGELHLRGPVTRAHLTQDTGLNRSTIGTLVASLVELGLVTESPSLRRHGAGRPSHVVGPRADGPYALAVDIDAHELMVAAVGIGGGVLARHSWSYPTRRVTPEQVVDRIVEASEAVGQTLSSGAWVAGMGVAVPGTVRRRDGWVHMAPNLAWRDIALTKLVATELGQQWPVVTGNDADLGALAEHRRGAARGIDDVLFVAGRVGLGGGIITGGQPLVTVAGMSGEIGHMVVDPAGPQCLCGNRGCWETFLGQAAFADVAGSVAGGGSDPLASVVRAAASGDAAAAAAAERAAGWLGRGLANLASILNPTVIVIGGHLSALQSAYEDVVRCSFDANMRAAPAGEVEITVSTLGRDGVLLGAAEMGFASLLADPAETVARLHDRRVVRRPSPAPARTPSPAPVG